jgi:hypothetical protein
MNLGLAARIRLGGLRAFPQIVKRRITVLVAVTLCALAFPSAAASATTVSAYDSLVTIRSDQSLPPGASASASIGAAGNEVESFQLAVQAGSTALSGVRVDPGQTLTGPGGATIPASNLTIYRERQHYLKQRSDAEGAVGFWPDALIPERDDFYGEDRKAFPVYLAAGQKVAVWIDVWVPSGAAAGTYTGSVVVRGGGATVAEVPVHLTVYGFSIPSTATLKSAFGGSGKTSLWGGDQTLYAAAALNNRVSIVNLWPFPDSRFLSYVRPLLRGTDPRVKLVGAQLAALTAFHCATFAANGTRDDCLVDWRDLAQRYPIVGSRFFDYICDEPSSDAAWTDCNKTADDAESIWPGVRKLVTTDAAHVPASCSSSTTACADWATDLSPLVNDIYRDGLAPYTAWHSGAAGRRLWPYTSCRSYSCDSSEDPTYDSGWPGYAIDEPASQARAMSWLAFTSGANGELYYDTAGAIDDAMDAGGTASEAWTNKYLYRYGGNGDGTLFYPGTTDIIGGTHEIPVESIRLKRIRDGREDYEYLHILAQRGQKSDAMTIARGLFPSMKDATASPSEVSCARSKLAAMIMGGSSSC